MRSIILQKRTKQQLNVQLVEFNRVRIPVIGQFSIVGLAFNGCKARQEYYPAI